MEWEKFNKGEKVRLDKDYRNTSIVEVVSQTPKRMYTAVKSDGQQWEVMTNRLTSLNDFSESEAMTQASR